MAEDRGARGVKDFHQLYRGVTSVARTRSLRRLVDALLGYLSAMVEQADDDTLRLDALAFVKDGGALLAPAELRSSMASIERRLNARGLKAVDRPWTRIDVGSGELVVTEPSLEVDWRVVDELDAGDRRDRPVPPGRYPIVGWGFGVGPGHRGPISRALALTLAGARLLDRPGLPPQEALDRLARVIGRVEPVALWGDRPEHLVGPLATLAGTTRPG